MNYFNKPGKFILKNHFLVGQNPNLLYGLLHISSYEHNKFLKKLRNRKPIKKLFDKGKHYFL